MRGLPERSFSLQGWQFSVCSRCTGLFAGLPHGLLLGSALPRLCTLPPWLVLVGVLPMFIDWLGTWAGFWSPNQLVRMTSGLFAATLPLAIIAANIKTISGATS